MTANNLLMQFLADVLDARVVRPIVAETRVAGRRLRRRPGRRLLARHRRPARQLAQGRGVAAADGRRPQRERGYRKWRKAVTRAMDWVDDDD